MKYLYLLLILLLLLSCTQEKEEIVEEDLSSLGNLGFYYAQQGDNEKAKEYFEKVIAIDLSHETARKNLALIYFKEQDFAKAEEHFALLTRLYPDNPGHHYDLAISIAENCRLKEVCDLDKAISELEMANQLQPGYQKAEDNIIALREVQKQLKLDSNSKHINSTSDASS